MDVRAAIAGYVKDRLNDEIAKGERGTAAAIAKAIDRSSAHVANVKNGKSQAGEDVARDFAKYWKMSYAELEAAAIEWAKGRPEFAETPVVESPASKLANWSLAVGVARAEGLSEQAIRSVEATITEETPDKAPLKWLKDIELAQPAKHPALIDVRANNPMTRATLLAAVRGVPTEELVVVGFQPHLIAQMPSALTKVATLLRGQLDWLSTGKGAALLDKEPFRPARSFPELPYGMRLELAMRMRGLSASEIANRLKRRLASAARTAPSAKSITKLVEGGHVSDPHLPSHLASVLNADLEWLGVPEAPVALPLRSAKR